MVIKVGLVLVGVGVGVISIGGVGGSCCVTQCYNRSCACFLIIIYKKHLEETPMRSIHKKKVQGSY